jgi:hypothetical protein
VRAPEVLRGVVDSVMDKSDSALLELVGELELVEDLKLTNCGHLGLLASRQRVGNRTSGSEAGDFEAIRFAAIGSFDIAGSKVPIPRRKLENRKKPDFECGKVRPSAGLSRDYPCLRAVLSPESKFAVQFSPPSYARRSTKTPVRRRVIGSLNRPSQYEHRIRKTIAGSSPRW